MQPVIGKGFPRKHKKGKNIQERSNPQGRWQRIYIVSACDAALLEEIPPGIKEENCSDSSSWIATYSAGELFQKLRWCTKQLSQSQSPFCIARLPRDTGGNLALHVPQFVHAHVQHHIPIGQDQERSVSNARGKTPTMPTRRNPS